MTTHTLHADHPHRNTTPHPTVCRARSPAMELKACSSCAAVGNHPCMSVCCTASRRQPGYRKMHAVFLADAWYKAAH
jgi:hypothetical protein